MTELVLPDHQLDLEPHIAPGALRRLNRLHAQAELMQSLADQTANALRQAATAACEDIGVTIPEGANVDIDFSTGRVKVLSSGG